MSVRSQNVFVFDQVFQFIANAGVSGVSQMGQHQISPERVPPVIRVKMIAEMTCSDHELDGAGWKHIGRSIVRITGQSGGKSRGAS